MDKEEMKFNFLKGRAKQKEILRSAGKGNFDWAATDRTESMVHFVRAFAAMVRWSQEPSAYEPVSRELEPGPAGVELKQQAFRGLQERGRRVRAQSRMAAARATALVSDEEVSYE